MKNDKNQGYVYILTNESFREDWVKIGKSSRPVDVRSKELDNTAVPLPFNIYATIKTVKYNEVEKMVHRQIDRLTDLRIRKTREFFNIRPEVALDILMDIYLAIDDAVIQVYENDNVVKTIEHDQPALQHEFFYTKNSRGANATGYWDVEKEVFTVLKGSTIAGEVVNSFRPYRLQERQRIINEHSRIVNGAITLIDDITFPSPSMAAIQILGRPSNGWTEWKNKDGETLDVVYRKK